MDRPPINKRHRHRAVILTVAILVVLNLAWWLSDFKPYLEWPEWRSYRDLGRDGVGVGVGVGAGDLINQIRTYKYAVNEGDIYFYRFFTLIDSVASVHLPEQLSVSGDLVLVAANPWILDSLRQTDYRDAAAKGRMIDDLNKELIIPAGAPIRIPDSLEAIQIADSLRSTRLVLNIPEFKLRLIRAADTILTASVRVGRNEQIFLEAVGHEVDLRTPVGEGHIYRVWRTPKSVNLHTGEVYEVTRRDDNRVTKMPPVPSLEPEINGYRTGKMIHATTNPVTLGKAYSHGCVGVSEADMWTIYFNMPVGAKVEFRYDLNSGGKTFKDVYGRERR